MKTHNGTWDVARDCTAADIIVIAEGLQCTNCGAVSIDHGATWIPVN